MITVVFSVQCHVIVRCLPALKLSTITVIAERHGKCLILLKLEKQRSFLDSRLNYTVLLLSFYGYSKDSSPTVEPKKHVVMYLRLPLERSIQVV